VGARIANPNPGVNVLQGAENFFACEGDGFAMMGPQLVPIAHSELAFRGFAGGDHFTAFPRSIGHGFLTKNVFPGPGGAKGEIVMEAVREDDVHNVDGGIIDDALVGVIGIDADLRGSVVCLPLEALCYGTGHDCGEAAVA
jgi:hypothetical protein